MSDGPGVGEISISSPPPEITPHEGHSHANPVHEEIERAILQNKGRITFADFMGASLYTRGNNGGSDGGYYASGRANIDPSGDFVTSPEISPAFGALLADEIQSQWEETGKPSSFSIVEMGAGNGTMAKDILNRIHTEHPALDPAVNYTIVEYSPGLISKQKTTLSGHSINWIEGSASELPLRDVKGVFVSNELPDAFPVHKVVKRPDGIKEIYVEVDENHKFHYVEGEVSDPSILEYLKGMPEELKDGKVQYVNLNAIRWIQQVAHALEEGFVITIDYGGTKDEHRALGQIRGYMPGKKADEFDILEFPGKVDITSDVDFDALQRYGQEVGLETVYYGDQRRFLENHNFMQLNRRLKRADVDDRDRRSQYPSRYAATLVSDLGNAVGAGSFKILIQRKAPQSKS